MNALKKDNENLTKHLEKFKVENSKLKIKFKANTVARIEERIQSKSYKFAYGTTKSSI